MARQKTPPGVVIAIKLSNLVPADAVPMGDGRHLYSPSRREVINWEACFDEEVLQPGPPGPPAPPTP